MNCCSHLRSVVYWTYESMGGGILHASNPVNLISDVGCKSLTQMTFHSLKTYDYTVITITK